MRNDLPKLLQAISFAAKKHSTQKRKGADEQPYINHPLEVLNLLANVGKIEDYNVLIAAVLHDTIEDTETTREEITELFGAEVCEMGRFAPHRRRLRQEADRRTEAAAQTDLKFLAKNH